MNPIRPIALAVLLAASLIASAQTAPQPTRADAEKDPVLKAMLTELDRSKSDLQLKDFQKPFFIQYRIEDIDNFETKAEFGAGTGAQRQHQRVARVTVRVGDYKTDSSGGRGDGAVELAALDDDPVALRSALWTATDQAYKNALAIYAQKQAALKQVQTPPQADDFSRRRPSSLWPSRSNSTWTRPRGRPAWRATRGLYRTDAERQGQTSWTCATPQAVFTARVTTTWLVNSEGTIVRKSASEYQEGFGVGAQAADGMRLDRSYSTDGVSLKDLDSAGGLCQARSSS